MSKSAGLHGLLAAFIWFEAPLMRKLDSTKFEPSTPTTNQQNLQASMKDVAFVGGAEVDFSHLTYSHASVSVIGNQAEVLNSIHQSWKLFKL